MSRRPFYSTCVKWPEGLMAAKDWLDDHGEEIGREDFLRRVDSGVMRQIERGLGYGKHLRMVDDYHVRYFLEPRSGIPFFVHSATEYVFAEEREIEVLDRQALDAELARDDGILVIDRIGRMAGKPPKDPEFEGDLQDEAVERLICHQGAIIIVADTEDANLPVYVSLTIERALQHAGQERTARIWLGLRPQDGAQTSWEEVIETESALASKVSEISVSRGFYGELEFVSSLAETEPQPAF
ncbi:hypothetical protein AB9K35_04065 [Leisingera sp. XS_AS12]|uniref:hypothetical protein n=1 Tax=Leisingera sp. XS_AS12 TaxID=3241294 RepID=UPI003511D864